MLTRITVTHTARVRRRRSRRGGVFLLVALTALATAGDARADALPLHQALRQALEHNHRLSAAEHAEEAASWAHRHAISQLLPSISLESRYTRLDDETVGRANALGDEITMFFPDSSGQLQPFTIEIPQTVFRDGYETSLTGQLMLLTPAVWNGVSIAGASKEMAGQEFTSAVNTTMYETLIAFVELLRLDSLAELQENHMQQAEENAALAERLFKVGRYAEADVLRWQVEVAQQTGALYEQQRGVRVAALTLENLIGAEPRGNTRPAEALPAKLEREIERFRGMDEAAWQRFLQSSLEEIIAGHPRQAILASTERLAELQHRQSLVNFLPSIAVTGSYGWQNNDTARLDGDKAWAVTAALSMPLFTSLGNYSERERTKYALLETRESIESGRRALMLGAEAARSAIRSSSAQLRLAEVSLQSASRSHEIQQNSYTLGRLSNLEWIDANLALQAAAQSCTSAYYDLVIAIADYHESRGDIPTLVQE